MAVEWLEAAEIVETDNRGQRSESISKLLSRMREQHDSHWKNPADEKHQGRFPNEELFVERIFHGDKVRMGRELRHKERTYLEANTGGEIHNLKRLCQGEIVLEEELRDNTCRLLTLDSYFTLGLYFVLY